MAIRIIFAAAPVRISKSLAQPAKSTEPSETALIHPAFRKDNPSVFDFGGNVQDESECLVDKFHGCPAITRIAGKRLDARVFLRRTRRHGTTRHSIAAIGCVDRHMQQVAEEIDHAVAFMPFDLLAAVDPAFFARLLGLDALRVDHPRNSAMPNDHCCGDGAHSVDPARFPIHRFCSIG
jgi:hypothetical protein